MVLMLYLNVIFDEYSLSLTKFAKLMKLLIAQKNDLFDTIVASGESTENFKYEDSSYDATIRYKNTDYKFIMEEKPFEKEYILKIRPSKGRYQDILTTEQWSSVVTIFKAWLSYIKREEATTDKWH